ncbi:unnamed protein product [Prorocentrum cordatum]|uniref:Uncharacterized protein n=1 Tax=Prorocentrum cordatum TaxID=2364126 RepID=A0ABN9QF12_9DINO|nr:unnamed protein product [Polarella glacialis]
MQLPRVSLAVTLAVLRGIVLPAPVSAEARTELVEDDQLDLAHASALGLQRSWTWPAPAPSASSGRTRWSPRPYLSRPWPSSRRRQSRWTGPTAVSSASSGRTRC